MSIDNLPACAEIMWGHPLSDYNDKSLEVVIYVCGKPYAGDCTIYCKPGELVKGVAIIKHGSEELTENRELTGAIYTNFSILFVNPLLRGRYSLGVTAYDALPEESHIRHTFTGNILQYP